MGVLHEVQGLSGSGLLAGYGIIGLFIAICVASWTYRDRGFWASSSKNKGWIKGPVGKPFRGNIKDLQTNGAASCHAWYSLYQKYGPAYELTVPFFRFHVINHPTYLEHIQKHNSKNYIRGAFTRNAFKELHRTSVFVTDGQEWQRQRKAATRAFSKKNFDSHITKSLHQWLDVLMRLLTNLAEQNIEFDFQALMSRFMFSLFLQLAFHEYKLGLDVMSDDPESLKTMPEYVSAMDEALHLFDRRRRDPMWRITERLSGESSKSTRAVNLFYGQIDGLIERRIAAINNGTYKPTAEAGVDLLDLFMQSTSDKYTLGGMVFAFLSAGRDTTAYNTSWLMKEIHHRNNRHLNAIERIRSESVDLGLDQAYLVYGDTSKLRFTNAMWDETARLNPVSPAGQMEAAEDDVLPEVKELGMPARYIKKGDIVSYQNYVLARMPEVWGEDASEFKPSRWFTETGESISYSPFKYHSWNAGPRSCLGRALATYEGIAISTAILQRFDVILSDDKKHYEPLAALNMGIKDGLMMRVRKKVGSP